MLKELSNLEKLREIEDQLHKFLTHKQKAYEELLTELDSILTDLEDEQNG